MNNLSKIEKDYVLDSYRKIANHFSQTRYKSWPSVTEFINGIKSGSDILDAGCGNGKNMLIRNDLKWIGCDICPELLDICRSRELNVLEADIRKLPFASNFFDNVISVAVIHHIDTFDERVKSVQEMIRVTKLGGKIYFQVWQDVGIENKKFQRINDNGDFYVSWKASENESIKRFYHLFKEYEIDQLLEALKGIKILKKYIEVKNWVVLLEKI